MVYHFQEKANFILQAAGDLPSGMCKPYRFSEVIIPLFIV